MLGNGEQAGSLVATGRPRKSVISPPKRLSEWQKPLLRLMLRTTAISCVFGPMLAAGPSGAFPPFYWVIEVYGWVLLLISLIRAWQGSRLIAQSYLVGTFLAIIVIGYHSACSPSVVVSLSCLVVGAGLLFAGRGVLLVAIATCLLLELTAVLVHLRLFSVPLTHALDPRIGVNWLRLSAVYMLVAGASAWVLRVAVETIESARLSAGTAFSLARKQLAEAKALRLQNLERERAIYDAQKLQMVAQLGDGFAHVFNDLLTVVRCACEELKQATSIDLARQAAATIREVANECGERTRELLLLSRPHAVAAETIQLDVALRNLSPKIPARLRSNVVCEVDAQATGTVGLPASWFEQIAMNLLLNAEQAMPAGGKVCISSRTFVLEQTALSTIDCLPQGVYAALLVADSGEGMTWEVAQRACEPFFSTKSRAVHAGLGLTSVHTMARQLGGSVQLSRLSRGTQVLVLLPCIEATMDSSGAQKFAEGAGQCSVTPKLESEPLQLQSPDDDTAHDPQETTIDTSVSSAADAPRPLAGSGGVVDWQAKALDEVWHLAVFGMVAFIVVVAATMRDRFSLVTDIVALGLLVIGSRLKSVAYRMRLEALLIGSLAMCALSLSRISYLAPGSMATLVGSLFVAAVFGTRRTVLVVFAALAAIFAVAGWFWGMGFVSSSLQDFAGDEVKYWLRIGVTLPSVILIVGASVLRVFSVAKAQLVALDAARVELENSRELHQTETQVLMKLEETRRRAERMEAGGRLTGMMAHDLNNSLGGMMGWATLIEEADSPKEMADAIKAIAQSADFAEFMVQQLQLRSEVGHRGESISLSRALKRMKPMLAATARRKSSHSVTVDIQTDKGCFVAIKEHSLRRLLLNLVANARDACSATGGHCDLSLRSENAQVVLEVTDSGCGMDATTKSHLFEPFFSTKGQAGTGLGLHSVAKILETTDATVDVWSELGVGTRLTIRWPLAAPCEDNAEGSVPSSHPGVSARILFAEDEESVRRVLARGLRRSGFTVVEACDGDDAALLMESQAPFDALCTDAVMPGVHVAELIRGFNLRFPGKPVLVISGYLVESTEIELVVGTGVSLLHKPFTQATLVAQLNASLGAAA